VRVHKPPRMANAKFVALFYGLTDTGKTYLLGSAQDCPETSPTLFIDIDGGTLTLAGQDIHVVAPKNFAELQEVYDFLREDNDVYKSVCLDSLTAQQRDMSMPTVLGELDEDQALTDLSRSKPPTQRDWLASGHQMRQLLQAFRGLAKSGPARRRIHVFASAGERVDERRDLGVPALPGVLGTEVGGYVDTLARLVSVTPTERNKKEVRYLYTMKHLEDDGFVYLGKNRRRLLPRRVKDPSVSKLIRYWQRESAG